MVSSNCHSFFELLFGSDFVFVRVIGQRQNQEPTLKVVHRFL